MLRASFPVQGVVDWMRYMYIRMHAMSILAQNHYHRFNQSLGLCPGFPRIQLIQQYPLISQNLLVPHYPWFTRNVFIPQIVFFLPNQCIPHYQWNPQIPFIQLYPYDPLGGLLPIGSTLLEAPHLEESFLDCAMLDSATKELLNGIGESWFKALIDEFSKEYFINLANYVKYERSIHTVYPPEGEVFSWTKYCSIDEVKVIILAQDPFHEPGEAHGLAFSVPEGVTEPPSLKNVFKAVSIDIPTFNPPGHGTLIGWATQGVLLLNTCLTVKDGEPNSHKGHGWETFTDAVISYLNENREGLVFMLWGNKAKEKNSIIDKEKHLVLTSYHPSPFSAYKGFFDCKHFSMCNDFLMSVGKSPIDWNYLPPQSYFS